MRHLFALAAAVTGLSPSLAPAQADPAGPVTITVEGRLLSGPNAFAQWHGRELLLPVVRIAEALGDTASVDLSGRALTVRRRSGISAQLDLNTGQVFEDGQPVMLSTSSIAHISGLGGDPQGLLLPVDLVSALLQASVVVDPTTRTLRVVRDLQQVSVRASDRFQFFDLYRTGYFYRGELAPESQTHSLQLQSSARVGDGLAAAQAQFIGNPPDRFFDFRHGLLSYERPNGQRLMLGDVTTQGDIDVLSAALRGAWYRQPFAGADVTAFAGLARSGAPPDITDPDFASGLNFDTPVVGAYYTLGRNANPAAEQRLGGALGGFWFNGPVQRAGVAGASFHYGTPLHTFQAEAGVGVFDTPFTGASPQMGYLLGVTESLTPTPSLTLVAGLRHISDGYRSPTGAANLRPMNLLSGGVSWRPFQWLSMSGGARYQERLDLGVGELDHDLTGNVVFSALAPWATLSVSHSEGRQSEVGGRSYSLAMLMGSYAGVDYSVNASQSVLEGQDVRRSVVINAGKALTPQLTLRASQSFGSSGAVAGNVDVFLPTFFTPAVSVSMGLGYSYSGVELAPTARLAVSAQLPWKQYLSLAVNQTLYGAVAALQLSGPLYDPPGAATPTRYSLDELSRLGSYLGRVYQDVNLDGVFDPAVDRPLEGVQVLVDGSNAVTTDEDGLYRFTNVLAGNHTVFLNLLTVRADLSLLSRASREVALGAGSETRVDFSLVRTGRASGMVWLDLDGDGERGENEPPLGQIRIVAGQRDTLTDADGHFVLGDLPQGQHRIVIDEKTLPEGLYTRMQALDVEIVPPRETRNLRLPIQPRAQEIEIREF